VPDPADHMRPDADRVSTTPGSHPASIPDSDRGSERASQLGPSGNLYGIVCMIAAMTFFVTNDTFIKLASDTLATGQIIFLRGFVAIFIVGAFALFTGALSVFPRHGWKPIGWRTVGEIGASIAYLTALFNMPIANTLAILQAMPLVLTLVSALLLGEIVRWRRWLAVGVGFFGMLLVVQPGSKGFDIYAIAAVIGLLCFSLRDLSSRFVPRDISSWFVALITMGAMTVFGGLWTLAVPWQPVTGAALIYILCSAVLLSLAFYFIVEAMRHGEVSIVTPFRYTIIVGAVISGFVVWGELPDMLASIGIVLIVGSGLYVFYRESRVHHRDIERSGDTSMSDTR